VAVSAALRGALVVALALGAACDGPGVLSVSTGRLARAGAGSTPQAIVGTWRRTLFFLDDFNFASASETTFQFDANGTVVRVLVVRNFTLGLADVSVATGRWRMEGTQVVMEFTTPSPFQLRLEARIVGDQLDLGGQTYLRVLP
jgi:hypothetical protein